MGRYDNLNIQNKTGKGLVYHSQLLPYIEPTDSDILIVTEEEDRLDLLANQFYSDSTGWPIIATANNLGQGTLNVEAGIQIRIPDPTKFRDYIIQISNFNSQR